MPEEVPGSRQDNPKLLLHICCVGCGVYAAQLLKQDYDVILFFYNPNIWPEEEYEKRLAEAKKVAAEFKLELVIGDYDHDNWLTAVSGHETDPEKGGRCSICYKFRLDAASAMAKELNCDFLTTTLTTSPHKNALTINEIGEQAAKKYGLNFLIRDFKKQDGFKILGSVAPARFISPELLWL